MAWIIKLTHLSFRISKKKSLIMQYLCITLSKMGISPLLLNKLISFSILFIDELALAQRIWRVMELSIE